MESDLPDCNYGAVLHDRWGDDAVLIRLVFSGDFPFTDSRFPTSNVRIQQNTISENMEK